jgi:hypothetical protein
MQALNVKFNRDFRITLNVNEPCSDPGGEEDWCYTDFTHCAPEGGPVTGRVEKSMGQLARGTLLSGIITGWPPDEDRSVFARYTEATLPDGTRHPVCIEFRTGSRRCGPRAIKHPSETPLARAVKNWDKTAELNP